MCDQQNIINSRDKYILSFFEASSYLSDTLCDLLYSSHLRKPISWHLQPLPKMKNVSAGTSSNNMSSSYHSRVEGIVLCSVFLLEAVLISVGNLLTFVVLTSKKTLRKESNLLVINMAFADTILGAVSMPLYVYLWIGPTFWLWNSVKRNCPWTSLGVLLMPPSRRAR